MAAKKKKRREGKISSLYSSGPLGGRPRKLTPELIKEFRRLLPTVLFLETVSAALGIHKDTWRNWIRRGRAEAERMEKTGDEKPQKKEELFLEFFLTYKADMARGKIQLCQKIKRAADRHWQAAAWMLERRFPEQWGSDKGEIRYLRKQIDDLEKGK